MKITKNFLKFKQFLRDKKLKPVQKVIMEYLFKLHNVKFGYAFPSMKDLVIEVSGACNNTVISAIRKLEKMGLLRVNRENKNNRYYIKNIEDFLIGLENNNNVINETMLENKIAKDMNCSLEEAVNDLNYAKEKQAKNLIAYAKSTIKNGWNKLQNYYTPTVLNQKQKNGFANFTQRIYDYEKLEKALLG